ncbi:MAG: membrane protein insertase YidC, partial [Undibacterium sp.]|nr:membrane protein insertase YidC [Undibacterium sp.]
MDIKRTVLWVVFSMSLLILWDNWMRHTGKQSMFFPTSAPAAQQSKDVSASAVASAASAASVAAVVPGVPGAAPAVKSERITITTDVIKVDIDTIGGEVKRLELLKHKDDHDKTKNIVLFNESAKRTYLAQTGLLGGDFPNHKSGFVAKPGSRQLGSDNQVQLVLESEQAGVKLTKTFTFKKGDYVIDVKHDVTNNTAAAIKPSLYLQLLHDGTKPESGGMFSGSTEFYAPAVYTEANKFQKLDFEKIEKGSDSHATKANDGWISVIQHFFVS